MEIVTNICVNIFFKDTEYNCSMVLKLCCSAPYHCHIL